jgi:hypothetical protein
MPLAIALRLNFTAVEMLGLAGRSKDAAQARRLMALATIYDGGTRSEAALSRECAPWADALLRQRLRVRSGRSRSPNTEHNPRKQTHAWTVSGGNVRGDIDQK